MFIIICAHLICSVFWIRDDTECIVTVVGYWGNGRVASITSSYYKFAEAAILVFALDNPASFHVLSQHLLDIVTYAENAKIFLCGNKLDLVSDVPQVTDAEIEAFWRIMRNNKFYNSKSYRETPCVIQFSNAIENLNVIAQSPNMEAYIIIPQLLSCLVSRLSQHLQFQWARQVIDKKGDKAKNP
ncbi:hypothetical protein NQ317_007528 [Molorchus minor]|uniref:Uncharacterized protein n=1 Tax=Molorchus minor TaxID=1323400 RepID=A0ABQ9J3G0_9CUCU|nr:hypothetical protein NQ317_007528 [Molorchus minor]